MKNKMKSVARRIKRGHVKMQESKLFKNPDGTPKIDTLQRTRKGFWKIIN